MCGLYGNSVSFYMKDWSIHRSLASVITKKAMCAIRKITRVHLSSATMCSSTAEAVAHTALLSWHASHLVFKLQFRSELNGGEEENLPCSLYSDFLSIEWAVSMTLKPQINRSVFSG